MEDRREERSEEAMIRGHFFREEEEKPMAGLHKVLPPWGGSSEAYMEGSPSIGFAASS